jgi:hypothetical protein
MSAREQAEYYREFLLEELDSWLSMPDPPSAGLILIAQDAGVDPRVLRDYADPNEPPTPRTLPRDLQEQIEHAALQQIWAYQSLWGAAALTKPNDDILEFYEGKSGINVALNGVEQHQNLSMDEAWKLAKDFGGYESNQDARTYAVWEFSGRDGYEEGSGLSLQDAIVTADMLHQRSQRPVRVFDEAKLAEVAPGELPRATYTASKRTVRMAGKRRS